MDSVLFPHPIPWCLYVTVWFCQVTINSLIVSATSGALSGVRGGQWGTEYKWGLG